MKKERKRICDLTDEEYKKYEEQTQRIGRNLGIAFVVLFVAALLWWAHQPSCDPYCPPDNFYGPIQSK